MRTIQIRVRDGDAAAGGPSTREGVLTCVRRAVPDLTPEEADRVAKALWSRDMGVKTLRRTLVEVLGNSRVEILDALDSARRMQG